MKDYKVDEEIEYTGAVYPQLHGKVGVITKVPTHKIRGEQVTVTVVFDHNDDKPYCLMVESIRRVKK